MDRQVVVMDSQRLNTLQNCACKFDWTFNADLVPIQKAEPLETGALLHEMLKTYYRIRGAREQQFRSRVSMNEIVKICERVGENYALHQTISSDVIDETFGVFKQYVEYYFDEPHETLAVEQVGSRIIYEDEEHLFIYETKMDWVCRLSNLPILVVDHKHSRRRGPVEDLSNQFIGYCWMLGTNNIMVNKIGFQTSLAPKDKFERSIKSYASRVIEAWVQNTIWWYFQYLRHVEEVRWPQNLTSCDKYAGCIFREVCLSAPENRPDKLRSLFDVTVEKWDVGALL